MFRRIDDTLLVSPQIGVAEVAEARAQGVTTIINNRPEEEEPGQPTGAEIEAAARAAGMDYVAIPITHAGFSGPQVDAMRAALDEADGNVLAYCRSGTRSTLLWALAEAKAGHAPTTIAAKAADAGYDITPVRALVNALSAGN